jgi:transposase
VVGVVIGIDPHKGSHTAVALDGREKRLGQLRVRASASQIDGLLEWAERWPRRTWAIEGARGLGHLLAQQLLASGEQVLDVPPKLAARVRLLNTGQINKTDDNDARSVAIAALRGHDVAALTVEDHTVVMRVWARRYHDLGRLRTQAVCRLHTVLCELIPGGVRRNLRTAQAIAVLDRIVAETPIAQAKLELARELVTDLQRIDAQQRDARRRAALPSPPAEHRSPASTGSGRSSRPPCSAMSATSAASPRETGSPPTTAPHRSKSPPATGRSTGSPGAATDNSTTPST